MGQFRILSAQLKLESRNPFAYNVTHIIVLPNTTFRFYLIDFQLIDSTSKFCVFTVKSPKVIQGSAFLNLFFFFLQTIGSNNYSFTLTENSKVLAKFEFKVTVHHGLWGKTHSIALFDVSYKVSIMSCFPLTNFFKNQSFFYRAVKHKRDSYVKLSL